MSTEMLRPPADATADTTAEDRDMEAAAHPTDAEELIRMLRGRGDEIVEAAAIAMAHSASSHYGELGRVALRTRLESLYSRVVDAVQRRDVAAICVYARGLAAERYDDGYDVGELQTAFNRLEEQLWRTILHDLPPSLHAEALGVVSTVLGAAKDALTREYVTLAVRHRAPALDVARLREGVER
jgi:hypothetical protein